MNSSCDRTRRITAALLALLGFGALGSCGNSGPATTTVKDGDYTITETSDGQMPERIVRFIANQDATRWASLSQDPASKKFTVISDGKTLGTYGGVHSMQFTKAGKLIYVAGPVPFPDEGLNSPRAPANDMRLVIDGADGHGYENVMAYPPAWVASSHPRSPNQQIIAISDDGTHIAVCGRRGGSSYVELDGKEFGPYKLVRDIAFSADGKHFGWIISEGTGKDAVVIDGGTSQPVTNLAEFLAFNADGSSWVYAERDAKNERTIIRKGKGAAIYPGIAAGSAHDRPPEFTPDGDHVLSRIGESMVLDDKRIDLRTNGITVRVYVHPDTHELVCESTHQLVYYSLAGERLRTEKRKELNGVLWSQQSPDRRRTVTAESLSGSGGGELWNLGNGKTLKLEQDQAPVVGVEWGPSNKYAMIIGRVDAMGGRSGSMPMSLAVEDQLGAVYDHVHLASIGFSPDGQHVAYAAQKAKEGLVVVDTKELIPRYERIGAGLTYDSNDAFHFIAVRNSTVLRVRVSR
jgi:hypothetical protein